MAKKFWRVSSHLSAVMSREDEHELRKLHSMHDASFDDQLRAAIEFGHRVGLVEAFINEKLDQPDDQWANGDTLRRMEPSSYVVACQHGLDAFRGAVVWISVRYEDGW